MTHAQIIAKQLNVQAAQVSATIELLDSGNTLPFIARYRKEATGTLDEEQLRQIIEQLEKLRTVDERRDAILKSIEEQGKLTTQLQQQLQAANSVTALEDPPSSGTCLIPAGSMPWRCWSTWIKSASRSVRGISGS